MHGSFVSSPTNSVTADFKASPSITSTASVDEEDDGDDGDDETARVPNGLGRHRTSRAQDNLNG